jgi:hypothetical protein
MVADAADFDGSSVPIGRIRRNPMGIYLYKEPHWFSSPIADAG